MAMHTQPARDAASASASHGSEECAPSFLTGTSTEYLGKRPLPRVVRDRYVVIILGPPRSGKTSVAWRFAGSEAVYLNTRQLQDALVARTRNGSWSKALIEASALLLDGPCWLSNRPGVVSMLAELLLVRAAARRRTVICQCDTDGSVTELIGEMSPGSLVVIGLRFPMGLKGRLRFARRMCDDLAVARSRARGTEKLESWDYDVVVAVLRRPLPGRKKGAPIAPHERPSD
jgi:hypothetical protein